MSVRTFELHRDVDASGISGTGIVAEGIVFSDGTAVVRWRGDTATTTTYASLSDVEKLHGHGGSTRVVITGGAFRRGMEHFYLDMNENVPFSSVGGLEARNAMRAPDYITPAEHAEYLSGYRQAARMQYGEDWLMAQFGWAQLLTIGGAS